MWMSDMSPYFGGDYRAWYCPEAPESSKQKTSRLKHLRPWYLGNIAEQGRNNLIAMGIDPDRIANSGGSYSPNTWISQSEGSSRSSQYWQTASVKNPSNVPAFVDCGSYATWPEDTFSPPLFEGDTSGSGRDRSMKWVCLPRHGKDFTYITFLDLSNRRVDLKELYTLKWNRTFDTKGRYTTAGRVRPRDWPEWMQNMTEY